MAGTKTTILVQEKNTIHALSVDGKRAAVIVKNARDIFLVAMKMMMRIKLCAELVRID